MTADDHTGTVAISVAGPQPRWRSVFGSANYCRWLWHESWHGAPVEMGAMTVIIAKIYGICAASGAEVLGRTTFNPLVQGSTPGAPPA